ncbi:alcohol dehydrogenase [Mycobacterium malmoense]|uniref:NDMA-dependent alcohol dehydrogenase n=1 Tax=Mycobacterium malmoense TaxID=1780 RepID=UPI00080B63C5|nr:NDMA-dependent alcohol dehydrogenase [Mycobacterium malmoense]OCB24386.1 alcohol dehydrogenase [Mycobacterium malmoense]
MQTRAAVLWSVGSPWSVETIELDTPGPQEVLVRIVAAGLCHTDEHAVTGDVAYPLPMIGGHEGAGIVESVGAAVTSIVPGDHVVMNFVPSCGVCPSCVSGLQNLCDRGAKIAEGPALDGTYRAHARGQDLSAGNLLGAFADHSVVHESSVVKIEQDIPLELAALVSCGVATGWGSSVYAGGVRAGETVVVIGIGGIGMNAVQGARSAGAANIVVVDPIDWKRERAKVFGATHEAPDTASALALVAEITHGRMADCAILATPTAESAYLGPAVNLVGKRGRVVVTAIGAAKQSTIELNLAEVTFWEKTVRGALYGSGNPRFDIPNLLRLYRGGDLKLDELITHRYSLDEVNDGYEDMRRGRSLRGVLIMDADLTG